MKRGGPQVFQRRIHRARIGSPLVGQVDGLLVAGKKLHLKLRLQGADLSGNGALGEVQFPRGGGKGAAARRRVEGL